MPDDTPPSPEGRDATDALLLELARQAAVGRLVPGAAHEVNNPLTTILGHAQLLLARPDLDQQVRERLQLVASESVRAARVLGDLLAFSRERPASRHPCSLAEQARRVLALAGPQLYQDGLRVVTEFGDCPIVRADEREIQHALLALVRRAHQAMRGQPEERVLTVRTRAMPGEAWTDVLDTGLHRRAALPASPAPLAAALGVELDLALAHDIAVAHGGRLWLGPSGVGGHVSLVLPAGDSPGR